MKTSKYYFILFMIILLNQNIFSQKITNGNFENWSMINAYENPNQLTTGNINSYYIKGYANVTKSTDKVKGNYSAKLTTVIVGNDTVPGILSNARKHNEVLIGGQAYSTKPDTLFFSLKHNIVSTDTATVIVMFKNNNKLIGFARKTFTGSQSSWKAYSVKIQWFNLKTPDTMIFMALSSNPDGLSSNNSELYIDDVNFGAGNAPLINGSFENWTMKSFEQPNNWASYNLGSIISPPAYVKKSNDAYNGTYALEITTRVINGVDTIANISNRKSMYNQQFRKKKQYS